MFCGPSRLRVVLWLIHRFCHRSYVHLCTHISFLQRHTSLHGKLRILASSTVAILLSAVRAFGLLALVLDDFSYSFVLRASLSLILLWHSFALQTLACNEFFLFWILEYYVVICCTGSLLSIALFLAQACRILRSAPSYVVYVHSVAFYVIPLYPKFGSVDLPVWYVSFVALYLLCII